MILQPNSDKEIRLFTLSIVGLISKPDLTLTELKTKLILKDNTCNWVENYEIPNTNQIFFKVNFLYQWFLESYKYLPCTISKHSYDL